MDRPHAGETKTIRARTVTGRKARDVPLVRSVGHSTTRNHQSPIPSSPLVVTARHQPHRWRPSQAAVTKHTSSSFRRRAPALLPRQVASQRLRDLRLAPKQNPLEVVRRDQIRGQCLRPSRVRLQRWQSLDIRLVKIRVVSYLLPILARELPMIDTHNRPPHM